MAFTGLGLFLLLTIYSTLEMYCQIPIRKGKRIGKIDIEPFRFV
jgi:hypothetical protein